MRPVVISSVLMVAALGESFEKPQLKLACPRPPKRHEAKSPYTAGSGILSLPDPSDSAVGSPSIETSGLDLRSASSTNTQTITGRRRAR
jgi:hypothetical protein